MALMNRVRRDRDGYTEWVKVTDTWLLVLAVVFLVVLVVPIAAHLSDRERLAFAVANYAIWAVFAVDYFVRLYLALDRKEYVRRNLLDLLIVVVPFLRPLRAVRLLRLLRLTSVAGVTQRRAASLQARVSTYVGSTALVLLVAGSFAMYDVERHARESNIKSLPDALWWSITTITTVGYGDRYPTTGSGRLIAAALMLVGIALLGVITATIAAWFVGHVRRIEEKEQRSEVTLEHVLAEIERLHARLDSIDPAGNTASG